MIKIEKINCHGCHGCENICPTKAIKMTSDEEGFWYPEVHGEACIECKLCINICSAINPIKKVTNRKGFAAYNKDLDIRMQSSSGGVFSLLAMEVISKGGSVFGAGFNENNEVVHMEVSNENDLSKLRGSKYVQSKIGDSYKQCKEALQSDKPVLFTGTPCQISGLKSFLINEYDNLLTMDIICHGVPSPKIWEIYRNIITINNSLSRINFRDKSEGWDKYRFCYETDGRVVSENFKKNDYMRAFLSDLCLRPSCYSCKSKTLDRSADITVADFWGIKNVLPEINDHKGVSFIITHNDKTLDLIKTIEDKMVIMPVNVDDGVKYNQAAIKSVKLNPKRATFMTKVQQDNFSTLTHRLTKVSIVSKVKGYLKKWLLQIRNLLDTMKS